MDISDIDIEKVKLKLKELIEGKNYYEGIIKKGFIIS